MADSDRGDITRILDQLHAADDSAAQQLLPLVYDELHGLARRFFERQASGHTLQPTALVHEAYMRLAADREQSWEGREHFLAVAAKAMRQILVDHSRRRNAEKRGGGWDRVALDEAISPSKGNEIDFHALDEALVKLSAMDARYGQVVTLRFFGGLTNEAVARVLGVSRATVAEDWRLARAYLAAELSEDGRR